jgi:hypothetical protein
MDCNCLDVEASERIKNKVILLYSLKQLSKFGKIDKWKIQKTCFFTQYFGRSKSIKVMNYQFFKWDHGPMSANIVDDCNVFRHIGLVESKGPSGRIQELTDSGFKLVEDMEKFINTDLNRVVIDFLDGNLKFLGEYSGKELRDLSHSFEMQYMGKMVQIEQIPKGTPLLQPISDNKVQCSFTIPQEWMDTLELRLSYQWLEIDKALSTPISRDDLITWSEIFGST